MKIKKNGKVVNLTESDLKRIVKKVLNEEYGRDYSIDSLYSVIYDELINIPSKVGKGTVIDDFKLMMKSPIGGLGNFESVHSDNNGLTYDYENKKVTNVGAPYTILAMGILPKLKEMGIIKGSLSDPNELSILNRISLLLYRDLLPQLNNSSDMSGRGFHNVDDEGNPIT